MLVPSRKIKVPFSDLSVKGRKKFLTKISDILKKGDFILGEEVYKFEKEFSSYIGAKYCVGVSSGTDGILIALKALGISENDEVILPAFTFISSASPVLMLGARPVFVDIKANMPVIDEDIIEKSITKKTRAILVVHLYGYSCEIEKIKAIAKKYNLPLIEDVSQAQGSLYKNKKLGSIGDLAIFSFYPTKNLGAFGDAGAVVTSNKRLYYKLLALRNHGQTKKYRHETLGYNSRLDSLQAAILRIKLQQLDKQSNKKNGIAKMYTSKLSGLPIKLFKLDENSHIKPAWHLYVIRTKERNELNKFLETKGIICSIHYPTSLPEEKIFGYKANNGYINAKEYASSVLSLPFFYGMTQAQLDYVIKSIKEYFSKVKKDN